MRYSKYETAAKRFESEYIAYTHGAQAQRNAYAAACRAGRCRKPASSGFVLKMMLLIAAALIAASLVFAAASVKASGKSYEPVGFKSIVVECGDTLSSIAARETDGTAEAVSAFIKETKRMNSMADDCIKTGNYICVPTYQ